MSGALPQEASRGASLAERVEEQLQRLIDRGDFPRDCKLPTEFELCRRFGVSRPIVRGALARLREKGVVSSQQGSGSVVLRGPEAGGLRFPAIATIAELERFYEFRIAVEGETAQLAALRHTPETLAEIEAALRHVEDLAPMGAPELARDANFRFHRAVAQAAGNPFFVATLEQLPNLIGLGPVEVRNFGIDDPAARARMIAEEHRGILAAIRRRDAALARAEMQSHIAQARQHIYQRQPIGLVAQA